MSRDTVLIPLNLVRLAVVVAAFLICAAQVKAVSERTVQDLKAKLEKLLTEAEDCELIGRLATDVHKRALFLKLAVDLRAMARDIEVMIATHPSRVRS